MSTLIISDTDEFTKCQQPKFSFNQFLFKTLINAKRLESDPSAIKYSICAFAFCRPNYYEWSIHCCGGTLKCHFKNSFTTESTKNRALQFTACEKIQVFWAKVGGSHKACQIDPAFFLSHYIQVHYKDYQKLMVKHLLNAAKSYIPLL